MGPGSPVAEPGAGVVGRLAPSPTGRLHVGHARSFLLAWWHARAQGGRVLLRIEDLDRARVKEGAVDDILRDLEWLGLDWDGEPLLQSEDTSAMGAAVDELIGRGLAYPCVCSRREIQAALSAPHASDGETRYPGTCRGRFASVEEAERESGRTAGVRFRVREGPVSISDGFVGSFTAEPAMEVGDFLIARRDGVFAYQLAVVVDDARTGVTEVLRGDDLLGSGPRQELLYEALGWRAPAWIHVPLVVDEGGERLAKRRGDIALTELRTAGVDGRRIVAWAARSCGLEAPGSVEAAAVVDGFSLGHLPHDPARFGDAELADVTGRAEIGREGEPRP